MCYWLFYHDDCGEPLYKRLPVLGAQAPPPSSTSPPKGFVVRRNVRDYGAVGDGVHDTAALIQALKMGKATITTLGKTVCTGGCSTARAAGWLQTART